MFSSADCMQRYILRLLVEIGAGICYNHYGMSTDGMKGPDYGLVDGTTADGFRAFLASADIL